MKKTLYPHQEEFLYNILNNKSNKLLCQLSTGGGKTVVFTEIIKRQNKKTLIIVDSIDLVNQTISTFERQGLEIGKIIAGNKKIPEEKIIVAMLKTLYNRVKKDSEILKLFELCVVDECHIIEHIKIFPYLDSNCKILGFTATPVRLKRYKIDEYTSAVETMSDYYDDIVCGKPIEWLMKHGYLIPEKNEYIDFNYSGLKTDASGEFTQSSLKEVFQSDNYKEALRKTYDKLCDGKKTMIFTSSTETNRVYLELFKDKNVRMYDSKSIDKNRIDVVEWFRDTPEALLISCGVFTKGFDICDVEVILVARATKSLSLWIQIAGRGARITNKIEKPNFLLIDGGNNNKEHQVFSFDRDWKKIFFDKKIKNILDDIQDCDFCGFQFLSSENKCPNCGEEVPIKEKEDKDVPLKLFEIQGKKNKLEPPTLDINHFINKGSTKYETLKALKDKWVFFLCKLEIKESDFIYHEDKQFKERFRLYLRPIYFKIITSILKDSKNVKYDSFTQKILKETKLKKYGTN